MALFGKSDDDLRCTLCSRTRKEVRQLVAGNLGAVCSDCLPDAIGALPGGDAYATVLAVVEAVLAAHDVNTPLADSRPLVEAALALSRDQPDHLRRLAEHAFRLSHFALGLDALGRISASVRSTRDVLNQAYACQRLGRHGQGLQLLAQLDLPRLSPEERGLCLHNQACMTLKSEPSLTGEALARERERIEEARMLFGAMPPSESRRSYLASTTTGLALCAMREPDFAHAEALLREVLSEVIEPGAEVWLQLGDALAAQDDPAGARDNWRKALRVAHPQTREWQEAQTRLNGVYR